jgi:KTSC domain
MHLRVGWKVFMATVAPAIVAQPAFPWEGQRVNVASSVFEAAAYRAEQQELTLYFDNGAVYVYREVPASVYGQFLDSPGKGAFFHRHIRGRFDSDCRKSAASLAQRAKPTAPSAAVRDADLPSPQICRRAATGGGA